MKHATIAELIHIHLGASGPCTSASILWWVEEQYAGPVPVNPRRQDESLAKTVRLVLDREIVHGRVARSHGHLHPDNDVVAYSLRTTSPTR